MSSKVIKNPLLMGLLALAIAPGIFICLFIYAKDSYNREPPLLLLWSFVLGMLSTIPAVIIQLATGDAPGQIGATAVGATAFFAYCIVGLSEEASKFFMLRVFLYKRKAFDDPFDGIIYAVMVGMGFATLENILYVMQHGYATGVLRMFLSVPAHGTFAVLMGYFTGLAKFNPAKRMLYFLLAVLLPVLFHGTFDFFLFLGQTVLHIAGAIASFLIALFLSFKAIRHKQQLSRAYMEQNGYSKV
jgi:protease PrsW